LSSKLVKVIEYISQIDFEFSNHDAYTVWLQQVATSEDFSIEALTYVFVSDEELHKMNVKYLNHNTLTDIITFNYVENVSISGDIFISIDRVKENALDFKVSFEDELRRVMVHGLLHLMNYNDKTVQQQAIMTQKEDEKLNMFHVEH